MALKNRELIRRLRALEAAAWETLCREISPMLLTDLQIGFSCDMEQAEEIVQRTWVRAIRSIRGFDPQRGQLGTWLKTISRNEARRHLGREYHQRPLSQLDPETLAALEQIDHRPLPDQVLEQRELHSLVQTTVWELEPHQRSVLIQKYMDELSVAEIAAGNGRSAKATESLLSRARLAFKKTFLRKIRTPLASEGGNNHVC